MGDQQGDDDLVGVNRGRKRRRGPSPLPGPRSLGLSPPRPPLPLQVDEYGQVPNELVNIRLPREIPYAMQELFAKRENKFNQKRHVFGLDIDQRGFLTYPENEEFTEWGRKWILQQSTIPNGGLGLFAGEDIIWDTEKLSSVPLFPYVGVNYSSREFNLLKNYYPNMRRYGVEAKTEFSHIDNTGPVFVGEARRHRNLSGYCNSSQGTGFIHQVEWEVVNTQDPKSKYSSVAVNRRLAKYLDIVQNQNIIPTFIMSVAVRPIRKGEELFADYPFMEA